MYVSVALRTFLIVAYLLVCERVRHLFPAVSLDTGILSGGVVIVIIVTVTAQLMAGAPSAF